MVKLYSAPGTCSIGIHVLLEEIGKPYEIKKLNIAEGDQFSPEFRAINPKSSVPTLVRDDGSVLTEFPAIALWLARANPEAGLLPEDADNMARAFEVIDYIVATMHMQGFRRMLRPGRFAPSEADHSKITQQGREIFAKGFDLMNEVLAGKDYVLDTFSIADAALFYIEFWVARRAEMALPVQCAAHFARLTARPAVRRVLEEEGFASLADWTPQSHKEKLSQ